MAKKPDASALFDKLMADGDRLPTPQLADIAAAAIHEFGGVGALAKMLVTEWHAAKPGSVTRAKILEPVLRGLRRDAELPPVGQLDDGRLKKLLATTLKELGELGEDPGHPAEHAAAGVAPAEGASAEAAQPVHGGVQPGQEEEGRDREGQGDGRRQEGG